MGENPDIETKDTNKVKDTKIETSYNNLDGMIEDWDIVECRDCGKKISIMGEAKIVNERYFVCKEGC